MKFLTAFLISFSLFTHSHANIFNLFSSEDKIDQEQVLEHDSIVLDNQLLDQEPIAAGPRSPSYTSQSNETSDSGINYAKQLSNAFTGVAERAIPAVVFITTEFEPATTYGSSHHDPSADDFFNRFFGRDIGTSNPFTEARIEKGQGSGFIISNDGYILTNYHVVRHANKITVALNDKNGTTFDAKFIGSDAQTDVALLKIDRELPFPFLQFENIKNVKVGEWAIAVGNPFDLEASVTVGVVSAKGRNDLKISDLEDFLQTDASIYPGNSGGPLLNLDGKVMGMNTAILTNQGNFVGIGFAIPSSILQVTTNQMIKNGAVTRGYIGVHLQDVESNMTGALGLDRAKGAIVTQVMKNSPAQEGGVQQGDVIVEVNGLVMKDREMVRNTIAILPQNSIATMTVSRLGKIYHLKVKIGAHDKSQVAMSEMAKKLGLVVSEMTPDLSAKYGYKKDDVGVVVTEVKAKSVAALARMRKGMLIINVNHEPVHDVDEFNEALEASKGKSVFLLANDHGKHTFISLSIK
ncbi:MAG: Do family serine endopeptidase [Rhabdochlamydiaceae bacterium]|nr:Do family serine endopeptidase [Candidatus Amphrikana amoebophyrae]